MKRFKLFLGSLIAIFGLSVGLLAPVTSVAAIDPGAKIGEGINDAGGNGGPTLQEGLKTVVNVLLFILGAIAVIVIVVGGLKYVTSAGDPSATKSAKDTILYAVVGLIVAILAYAIVNFVIGAFTGGSGGSGGGGGGGSTTSGSTGGTKAGDTGGTTAGTSTGTGTGAGSKSDGKTNTAKP